MLQNEICISLIIILALIWIISCISYRKFSLIMLKVYFSITLLILVPCVLGYMTLAKTLFICSTLIFILTYHTEINKSGRNFSNFISESKAIWNKDALGGVTLRNINSIIEAVYSLSYKKIGAMIVIPLCGVEEVKTSNISDGVPLHAEVSPQLIENIFYPNTPLHDGAAIVDIVKDNEIVSAGDVLPLSENDEVLPRDAGTRHRAAMGISQESHCVIVVVSEETGNISFVKEGEMKEVTSKEELDKLLKTELL